MYKVHDILLLLLAMNFSRKPTRRFFISKTSRQEISERSICRADQNCLRNSLLHSQQHNELYHQAFSDTNRVYWDECDATKNAF